MPMLQSLSSHLLTGTCIPWETVEAKSYNSLTDIPVPKQTNGLSVLSLRAASFQTLKDESVYSRQLLVCRKSPWWDAFLEWAYDEWQTLRLSSNTSIIMFSFWSSAQNVWSWGNVGDLTFWLLLKKVITKLHGPWQPYSEFLDYYKLSFCC